jgi:transcriptional regulator with XRE-family HTH domain
MSRVTEALIEARKKAALSQRQVADALGISYQFMNDIERGRRPLGEQHYEKLPEAIRTAVIKAAKAELRERLRKLDRIGKGQKSG